MVATNDYKNNKPYKPMYVSAFIFVFVIILTLGMYFYNNSLEKKINELQNDLLTLNNSLKEINEDNKVVLYNLIKENKVFLDKYQKLSQIPLFINNLKQLSKTYSVIFNGFSYNEGKINTMSLVVDDGTSLAYKKAENFIKYFRDSEENMFLLDFLKDFQGQEQIKFNTTFNIK